MPPENGTLVPNRVRNTSLSIWLVKWTKDIDFKSTSYFDNNKSLRLKLKIFYSDN